MGLHAEAGIAFAAVAEAKGKDTPAIPDHDYAGTGWLATLGFGWESWIGEQWSAGILGRIQYGGASLDADSGGGSVGIHYLFPTVLGTFTYH